MKKAALVALIAINAALVLALVFHASSQPAYGQVMQQSYVVITGRINNDLDAVYIIDLASRQLVATAYDNRNKQMINVTRQPIDLKRHFGRN